MDSTTQREVECIKANGYHRQSQTLGEGGCGAVSKFASNWANYVLFDNSECQEVETITAQDDTTAIKAFRKLYRLDNMDYEIHKKTVVYDLIDPKEN